MKVWDRLGSNLRPLDLQSDTLWASYAAWHIKLFEMSYDEVIYCKDTEILSVHHSKCCKIVDTTYS